MSTRSTTHFKYGSDTKAIVYRHYDGSPESAGVELLEFFHELKNTIDDNRLDDASYLAAKMVVWLANTYNTHYSNKTGKTEKAASIYDFLGVGVVMEDPDDIEYRYEVDCDKIGKNGLPEVKCFSINRQKYVSIPKAVKV